MLSHQLFVATWSVILQQLKRHQPLSELKGSPAFETQIYSSQHGGSAGKVLARVLRLFSRDQERIHL